MLRAAIHRIVLTAHPTTPAGAIRDITVEVRTTDAGTLAFAYALDADLSRIRVPAAGGDELRPPAGRGDGLWKHTCFEAFIGSGSEQAYWEFNFSPTGRWAAYRFDAYRSGMQPLQVAPPRITVRRSEHRLELDAAMDLADIPHDARLALSAIVEEEDGRLSYWAARHAPGKPDFHHPAGFLLELQPTEP